MAVSTSTVAWNSGYLVIASGTPAEVIAEIPAGTSSGCPLLNPDGLRGIGGTATAMTAIYFTTAKNW
jgi:hypothetical protein